MKEQKDRLPHSRIGAQQRGYWTPFATAAEQQRYLYEAMRPFQLPSWPGRSSQLCIKGRGMACGAAPPQRTWPSPEPPEPLLHWKLPEGPNFCTRFVLESTTYLEGTAGQPW